MVGGSGTDFQILYFSRPFRDRGRRRHVGLIPVAVVVEAGAAPIVAPVSPVVVIAGPAIIVVPAAIVAPLSLGLGIGLPLGDGVVGGGQVVVMVLVEVGADILVGVVHVVVEGSGVSVVASGSDGLVLLSVVDLAVGLGVGLGLPLVHVAVVVVVVVAPGVVVVVVVGVHGVVVVVIGGDAAVEVALGVSLSLSLALEEVMISVSVGHLGVGEGLGGCVDDMLGGLDLNDGLHLLDVLDLDLGGLILNNLRLSDNVLREGIWEEPLIGISVGLGSQMLALGDLDAVGVVGHDGSGLGVVLEPLGMMGGIIDDLGLGHGASQNGNEDLKIMG